MNTFYPFTRDNPLLKSTERKKFNNKIKIIKLIYTEGYKTALEICNELNISLPTSNILINELLENEMIEKKGQAKSSGGRKPDQYGLTPNSIFILAMNIGQNRTQMAIYNNSHERITDIHTVQLRFDGQEDHINKIYEFGDQFIKGSGINADKLLGIGITMPGLIDSKKGINYTYLNNLSQSTLKGAFQEKFNKQVVLENDAKAMTLAEFQFGSKAGTDQILGIYTDWGIGLGIVLDGKIYKGFSGFSGEFGHITMVENGHLCSCGKQGCLETLASGMAMVRLAKDAYLKGKPSIMNTELSKNIEDIDPDFIIQSALQGDQHAIGILTEIGSYLGKGISILVQLFNPEVIIIGGKIAEAGQYILTPIYQSLNTFCLPQLRKQTTIELSQLGKDARMLGAISIYMNEAFDALLD
ncbi:MAG TPA: ROK family protein [Anditalea sp.]|nr:ROK family protein [Anditalea sp.]